MGSMGSMEPIEFWVNSKEIRYFDTKIKFIPLSKQLLNPSMMATTAQWSETLEEG